MVLTLASLLLLVLINVGAHAASTTIPTTNVRHALMNKLRANASPLSPPPDISLPVNVKIHFKLLGIDSLCPKTHQMKARAYELYTWNDSRLAWSEKEFNVSYITLPTNDTWRPDLMIWQNMEGNQMRDQDTRAVILPNGEVTVKYATQPRIACNSTAWDMFLKTSGNSNQQQQQLPATYKCSFDMSSDLYDTEVVDLMAPVSGKTGDASGDQHSKTADIQWFKPNAVYSVKSFQAKRREQPYNLGPSSSVKLKLAVMQFDLVVNQLQSMAQSAGGSANDSGEEINRR